MTARVAVECMTEATLALAEPTLALSLFGAQDQHLRRIRENLGVQITHRDGEIRVIGDESAVAKATAALERLKLLAQRKGMVADEDVHEVLAAVTGVDRGPSRVDLDVFAASRRVRPRTPGQAAYTEAMRENELVFAVGPAGTG